MKTGLPSTSTGKPLPWAVAAALAAAPGIRAQEDLSAWSRRADFRLDGGPSGAALSADVSDFPLLLRLDSARFPFAEARPDGADVRFTAASGAALPFEIERWDAAARRAEIWLRLPLVRAGTATEAFRMHWGHPSAVPRSAGPAVFDSAGGFAGVWHLGGPSLQDATGRNPEGDASKSAVAAGVVGDGARLQGNNQGLVIPANAALAAVPGLTLSLWLNADGWKGGAHHLLQQGNAEIRYALAQEGDSLVFQVGATSGGHVVRSPVPSPGAWRHVAATYDGAVLRIYLDGALAASKPAAGTLPAGADELCLGCRPVQGKPRNSFEGRIDEVSVARTARSADWIRLAYASQRAQQTVVLPPGLVACPARFAAPADASVAEGAPIALAGVAECATTFSWSQVAGPAMRILDPEVKDLWLPTPRITGDTFAVFRFTARFGSDERSDEVRVALEESIPDPVFTLPSPAPWNGRDSLVLAPAIGNLAAVKASRDSVVRYAWTVSGPDVDTLWREGSLVLSRPASGGTLEVGLCLDNGGTPACRTLELTVEDPTSIRRQRTAEAARAEAPAWDVSGRRIGTGRGTGRGALSPGGAPGPGTGKGTR